MFTRAISTRGGTGHPADVEKKNASASKDGGSAQRTWMSKKLASRKVSCGVPSYRREIFSLNIRICLNFMRQAPNELFRCRLDCGLLLPLLSAQCCHKPEKTRPRFEIEDFSKRFFLQVLEYASQTGAALFPGAGACTIK